MLLRAGFMTKRIAALACCLSLAQGSFAGAEDIVKNAAPPVATVVVTGALQDGPLRQASLRKDTRTMLRAQTRWTTGTIQDGCRPRGSWMERHPVWAGALVGFGTGLLITYAVHHDDKDELLRVISPAMGYTFWGGVSAGVGALAGWGIGRNRDDGC